jgi:hypothetical protein
MTYTPTLLDAAVDIRRCIYASMEPNGFQSAEFLIFWKNANAIISENDSQIKPELKKYIYRCLKNAENKSLSKNRRQEDLLMAATLLTTNS